MKTKNIIIVKPEVFSRKELAEFEKQILTNERVTENEASRFFHKFPRFLTLGGYWQIAREIVLYKSTSEAVYRVDFCRKRLGEFFWDFVELKDPKAPLAVRKGRHWKFSSSVETAIHQASDYRDYFEIELNRLRLEQETGIRVYRPRLLLVCGRSSPDVNPLEIRKLSSRYNNVEINSYDDLYQFAKESYKARDLITVPVIQNFEPIESTRVVILLKANTTDSSIIEQLRRITEDHPGKEPLFFKITVPKRQESLLLRSQKYKVDPSTNFIRSISKLLRENKVTLEKVKLEEPPF
jgi:hypothetical protein